MVDGICFPANGATPLGLPSLVFRVCSHRLGSGTVARTITPARKPTAPSGTANAKTTWPAINVLIANSASGAGASFASGNTASGNLPALASPASVMPVILRFPRSNPSRFYGRRSSPGSIRPRCGQSSVQLETVHLSKLSCFQSERHILLPHR